ncbi:hypothetical protein PTTG_11927 [Puccinia triticina 1-1 BBBD Race 1]|uniref:Uncharacterized protein n=1 Tax=Puccinia triticina (isolate 1-1 / race 1 (BBBD)) TaxID=630390 RepID=A0A180G911_PUCT1|nr:hypothetical protein PTTG_11927 [Puccinia triticina 1-1 BBBD Race 1]
MSDSEGGSSVASEWTSSHSKTDRVREELEGMSWQFRTALGATYRPDANDEMIDERIGRNELIEKLESNLLPSLKDHITALLLLLDVENLGEQPRRNLDSVSELIPKIYDTLKKTTLAVESVSAPFEGVFTSHRKLGRCKEFRCYRLHTRVQIIITSHLCRLIGSGAEFMRSCSLSCQNPESLKHRRRTFEWGEKIRTRADSCYRVIDQTIKWSKNSDLAILQDDWLEAEELVNDTLEHLTKLGDPITDLNYERASINEPEKTMAAKKYNAQVARLTIPIVKLTRIFLYKMSNATPKKVSFTLDPEFDSKSLNLLSERPIEVAKRLARFTTILAKHQEEDTRVTLDGNRHSNPFLSIRELLESTLLLLAFYLTPLPAAVDDHSPRPQNQFKLWFFDLQSLYQKATDHMSDTLFPSQHFDFE